MIDLNFHILPGADDGAKSLEDSLVLAKKAAENGITTIFATPHHKNGAYENPKQKILQEVACLNDRLQEENINVSILPGQVTRIFGDIINAYDADEILTLNHTPYLLIELPSNHVPRYTEQILFDLQMKALRPIIVHPERHDGIIDHSDVLYNLGKKGALTQLSAASVSGELGKKIQKYSFELIEAGMAHFIASEAHDPITRPCNLREAYNEIEKQFGIEMCHLFFKNAQLVLNNQIVLAEPPQRIRRKKFLGIF